MSIKWSVAILMFMLVCTIAFSIMDKGASAPADFTTTRANTEYATDCGHRFVLDALTEIKIQDVLYPQNWVINFFSGKTKCWMQAWLHAALFDYAMFDHSGWVWIKYFFWCISFAWLIATIVAIGRGVSSSN
jgi:hypothetical protein